MDEAVAKSIASEIVAALWYDLRGRGGFDEWESEIDEETLIHIGFKHRQIAENILLGNWNGKARNS